MPFQPVCWTRFSCQDCAQGRCLYRSKFGSGYVPIGLFGKDQSVITVIKHIALTKFSHHIQGPSKEKAVKSLNLTVKKVKEGSNNISVTCSNNVPVTGSNKTTISGSKKKTVSAFKNSVTPAGSIEQAPAIPPLVPALEEKFPLIPQSQSVFTRGDPVIALTQSLTFQATKTS